MRKSENRLLRPGIIMGALALALAITGGVMVHMAGAAPVHMAGAAPACTTPASLCDTTLTTELTPTLSATVQMVNVPVTLDGTDQTVTFNLVINVVDTYNNGTKWKLQAKAGKLGFTLAGNTQSESSLTLTSASGSCTSDNSCMLTTTNTIKNLTDPNTPLNNSNPTDIAQAPDGGDFGTTTVTVKGYFHVPAAAIVGASQPTTAITIILSAL